MIVVGWHFRSGTEERVPVHELEPGRFTLACECGKNFLLDRDRHKVTFGPDGAMSAEHSFVCYHCQAHRHVRGGVIQ